MASQNYSWRQNSLNSDNLRAWLHCSHEGALCCLRHLGLPEASAQDQQETSVLPTQPPEPGTHPLQYQGQQGHINTGPMLNPILFLTAKCYCCSALLILDWELYFKMESHLYAWSTPSVLKEIPFVQSSRNAFQRCSKDVFKHLLNQCIPCLLAAGYLQNLTAAQGREEQSVCCWKAVEQITKESTEISGGLTEVIRHGQYWFAKPRVTLTELISFANLC